MPRISVTEKVPSLYLESFRPSPGMSYRVSVLASDPFCTLGHWISDPVHGVQGRYQCVQGECCRAFPMGSPGAAGYQFSIPVWVYNDPTKDASGQFYSWNMTQNFYKNNFQSIATTNDLSRYDIQVTARQQGAGTQLSATVVTNVFMRDYWTPELKAQIEHHLQSYEQIGDDNFVKRMTPDSWQSTLLTMGYDFGSGTFPVGFGTQPRFGGVPQAPQSLAALNQPGYIPPVPQSSPAVIPTVSAPQAAMSTVSSLASPAAIPGPMPAAPAIPVTPIPQPAAAVNPIPQTAASIPPAASAGIPPAASIPPAAPAAATIASTGIPPAAVSNEVPGVPITPDELAAILDI